ncbi:TPA: flagellar hook-basal body complex protein [bacterium]|nr:flagellar hook-basal body complex protein [bacterium]
MLRSLISGLSGIRTHQTSLDIIGNNIANINTPSYKASRASFSDALSLTLKGGTPPTSSRGGLNPFQVGRGSTIDSIDTLFSQGSLETTGNPTDLTIAGDGFFILRHGEESLYTRDGSFAVDATGTLIDPNTGYAVQGRMADSSGNILSSTRITDIRLPIESLFPARATSTAALTGNLDADAGTGKVPFIGNTANASFSGNLNATGIATIPTTYNKHIVIYDYLGNAHDITIQFKKSKDSAAGPPTVLDEWTWTASDSSGDVSGTGAITFKSDGSFDNVVGATITCAAWGTGGTDDITVDIDFAEMTQTNGPFSPMLTYPMADETYQTSMLVYDSLGGTHNVIINFEKDPLLNNTWRWSIGVSGNDEIYINDPSGPQYSKQLVFNTDGTVKTGATANLIIEGPGGFADGTAVLSNLENGSSPIRIALDLSQLAQFAGAFTPVPSARDGHGAGSLDNITFDDTGTLIGTFTNGSSQRLAQVVLADFYNPAGLVKVGGNLYSVSMNSGSPVIGIAGSGIQASVISNALEGSNVDLANEFTKMIIAQRGFEANSRVVTTSDAILGELINLKR